MLAKGKRMRITLLGYSLNIVLEKDSIDPLHWSLQKQRRVAALVLKDAQKRTGRRDIALIELIKSARPILYKNGVPGFGDNCDIAGLKVSNDWVKQAFVFCAGCETVIS